ncbi:ABC transporter permease subunit [Oscillospiraceae bacterium OttesenSCG-928-F05]|nr:ABC transporter permease subunit [Oscillospiraceae bacterium OttesenSCG-928-F05]
MWTKFAGIVFRKELVDILRDKRTIITGVLLPLLLYPVMFGILGGTLSGMQQEMLEDTTVALMGEARNDTVKAFLETTVFAEAPGIKLETPEDPTGALALGEVKVILNIPEGTLQGQGVAPSGGDQATIELYYDEQRTASQNSVGYVQEFLEAYNDRVVDERLRALGIDIGALRPVTTRLESVTALTGAEETGSTGALMVTMLIPMLVTIFLSTGSMSVAIDLFAGEKERKTFEPLLTTRAGRLPVLIGKFMAVTLYGICNALLMLLGMVVGYLMFPAMLTMGLEDMHLNIPVGAVVLAFLLIVLMAFIFSAIHVILSTWSRTVKEASSYSAFVMIAGMLPSFFTMYMQAGDVQAWMMAVPVLNVIGALKLVLGGVPRYGLIGLAILFSALFLAIILLFALRLFKKETVMFRL